jgi:uncharacterized protein
MSRAVQASLSQSGVLHYRNHRGRLLQTSHPALFARDGMGTSSALERLLSRERALEFSAGFVDPSYDIDVADDLTRLAAELCLAPERAPRTAVWLKERERVAAQLRTGTGGL